MKTINTKENQITLHTKDTIIEEDIVVNFEGGSGGGVEIPSVSNLNVDTYGILTFDEPDVSELADYNPTISYLVTVNDVTVEYQTNTCDIFKLLKEGENSIIVIVKVKIDQKDKGITENIEYSIPSYTNVADFTLETTTVDGVSGYKITAYNGTETEINIPPTNSDGLPILELNSINVSKIRGEGIKKVNSFQRNTVITEIDLPETTGNTNADSMFSGCTNLQFVKFNMSNVQRAAYMFRDCSSIRTILLEDTSNLELMKQMFYNCSNLTYIGDYNFGKQSSYTEPYDSMLGKCTSLKKFLPYGMYKSFDISASTQFEREDLVTILNNLATVTSTQTLTMGTTNLEKLTEGDKAIAIGKGWTLA